MIGVIDTETLVEVIWPEDPALAGKGEPTIFEIAALSGDEFHRESLSAARHHETGEMGVTLQRAMFFAGVRRIYPARLEDGSVGELPREQWGAIPYQAQLWVGGQVLSLSNGSPDVPFRSAPGSSEDGGS